MLKISDFNIFDSTILKAHKMAVFPHEKCGSLNEIKCTPIWMLEVNLK